MKTSKKVFLLLTIVLTCLLLYKFIDTYAKYRSSIQQTSDIAIARWDITVNNTSIQNAQSSSFTIQPVFPGTAHIASGIIAPTAEGYFDLTIDYTNVDVSFDYSITVEPNANSSVTDLVVTGYSVDNGQIVTFDPAVGIGNTILRNSGTTSQSIRVYIKWDDVNGSMNNQADTAATLSTSNGALLDVTASFIQITNINNTTNTTNTNS